MENDKMIIIGLIVIILIILVAMGTYAITNMSPNKTNNPIEINNTTNKTSVATTSGSAEDTQSESESHQQTTNTEPQKQAQQNNHNHHEDVEVETTYDDMESGSEDTYDGEYEIYADDRGRVSIGYWDDEGYWNAVETV